MSEAKELDPNKTLLDLETLDNINMGEVEAAPEFVTPPKGRYLCLVTAKFEDFNKEDKETGIETPGVRIRHIYSIQECLELKDKEELQPPKGSLFSETFMGSAEGLKYWKTRCVGILGDLGQAKVSEVMNALKENTKPFAVDIGQRKSKAKDKDGVEKEYVNITIRVVGEPEVQPGK